MATRPDVVEVKAAVPRLEGRIERIGDKMVTKADLARFETRMCVAMLTAVGAIVALVKLLP